MSEPLGVVLDATVLHHFALADRLDVLGELLSGQKCATTNVVLDEVRRHVREQPGLSRVEDVDWLSTAALASDEELRLFVVWAERLGAGRRHLGEASVFAYAEARGMVAITDDRDATRVGRAYGLEVHGVLWILADACRAGRLTEFAAAGLIDGVRFTGARLPCTGDGFPRWARQHGLL